MPESELCTEESRKRASLYVGDLGPLVTESHLYELFCPIGPVASIRVCRDSVSRRSLGYSYVNYENVKDAAKAIDALNYTQLKGNRIRIMWSQRDPSIRKSGTGNVFVKNIDKDVDNKALFDVFKEYGSILSCKIATDEEGKSLGYGFVHFDEEEAATQAINQVNGMLLTGKPLYVCPFMKRTERPNEGKPAVFTNVYVKHLPINYSEEQIKSLFEPFGSIKSCAMRIDPKQRKFAFVSFDESTAAAAAVEALHKSKVDDSEETAQISTTTEGTEEPDNNGLYVQPFQAKHTRTNLLKKKFEELKKFKYAGTNLYIKNLDSSVDDAALRQAFEPFGTIVSCKVMKEDETGKSRCFGFVCYMNPEEATAAVTDMHQKNLNGNTLYVGLAERREHRSSRLTQRFAQNAVQPGVNYPYTPHTYSPDKKPVNSYSNPPYLDNNQVDARNRNIKNTTPTMRNNSPWYRPGTHANENQRHYPRSRYNRGNYTKTHPLPGTSVTSEGFKFTPQARNRVDQKRYTPAHPERRNTPLSADTVITDPNEPINPAALAAAQPSIQKQILGEKLFPKIRQQQPEHAAKITGMMLEMDNSEILFLLESRTLLKGKIDEALHVLQASK